MPTLGRDARPSKVSGWPASTTWSSPASAFSGSASRVVTLAVLVTVAVPSLTVRVTPNVPTRE